MNRIVIVLLLFLCTGLNFWSYQVFANSSLKVNFTLNTLIITVIINLFFGYFYSVLLRIFTYKELKTNKQILIALNFCVFVSLIFWSIMILADLNINLSNTLSIIITVMIPIFYGYLYSILLKKLIYTELKDSKKNIVFMIFLVMVIIIMNFIFFRTDAFVSENDFGNSFGDENHYICPDGTETMDLSKCK
ncbi:hypothetical protein ACWKTZ_26485 [Bacillus cereus]